MSQNIIIYGRDSSSGQITPIPVSGTGQNRTIGISSSSSSVATTIDTSAQISFTTSRDGSGSIVLSATAGGIDIQAAGTSAEPVNIYGVGCPVNVISTSETSDAILLYATGGGIIIAASGEPLSIANTTSTIGINTSSTDSSSIQITSLGGTIMTGDTVRIVSASTSIGSTHLISLGGIMLQADGTDGVSIGCDNGPVTVVSSASTPNAIHLRTTAGKITLDSSVGILASTDTFRVTADNLDISGGAVNIDTTGAMNLSSAGGVSLDATVGDITINTTGTAILSSSGSTNDTIRVTAPAGGIDIDAQNQISITSAYTASGAISLDGSGGGVVVTSSIDSPRAIYLSANGGITETIELHAAQGTSSTSINIRSEAGGITLDTSNVTITEDLAVGGTLNYRVHYIETVGPLSLTSSDSGAFVLITGDHLVTLPAPYAGGYHRFITTGVSGGTQGVSCASTDSIQFIGTTITPDTYSTAFDYYAICDSITVTAFAARGVTFECISNGTVWIINGVGTNVVNGSSIFTVAS